MKDLFYPEHLEHASVTPLGPNAKNHGAHQLDSIISNPEHLR